MDEKIHIKKLLLLYLKAINKFNVYYKHKNNVDWNMLKRNNYTIPLVYTLKQLKIEKDLDELIFNQQELENIILKYYANTTTMEVLNNFLKGHKCYNKFYKNKLLHKSKTTPYSIKLTAQLANIISDSFNWDKTKEGYNYWWDLSSIFETYVKKMYSDIIIKE